MARWSARFDQEFDHQAQVHEERIDGRDSECYGIDAVVNETGQLPNHAQRMRNLRSSAPR